MYHVPKETALGDDVLYGANAIADFLGIPRRKAFYLLEQRRIPSGKLGREHVASRSALRAHFAKLAQGDPPDVDFASAPPSVH
jgi:hypothetical protein